MTRVESRPGSRGLVRVLALSVAAAVPPIAGAFLFPAHLQHYESLMWLLLLVPAFLWAYERGWRGVATALAFGMAALSVTYAVAQSVGGQLPDLLLPVIVAYVAVSLGIGLFGDRVARTQYAAATEALTLQDRLTGLANRRRVELHLELQFATAERGYPLAIVLFGIDHLHAYNLRNGRSAGDGVLKAYASLLRQQTRRMDLSSRYGPDQFLVVLAGATEEGAVIFAARVQEQLRAAEQTVTLPTVSAGVACYRSEVGTPKDLLRAAEEALRLAKEDGRDRVRISGRRLEEMSEPDPLRMGQATSSSNPSPALARYAMGEGEKEALGHGRAVLILTADPLARGRLSQILRQHAFEVTQATEPQETVASLRNQFDMVFVDVAPHTAAVADLITDIRFRSPATRVVGISPADIATLESELLRIRLDGHYVLADDETVLLAQVDQLLHEHDELADAQLRQHQLSHEMRSRDREMRAALAASEARYRTLVQTVRDVVFTTDTAGRWTSLNPAWTAVTGFNIDDSLGRPLFDYVHAEDADDVRAQFERILEGAPYAHQEVRWRTRQDSHRVVEIRLQAVQTADGAVDGVAGLLADVTDARRVDPVGTI
ncbi:hypothetical protein BH23GEM9_BH23GEM9_12740 [soil metagenome]